MRLTHIPIISIPILGTNVKPYNGCINKHYVNINVKFLLTNKFSVDIHK